MGIYSTKTRRKKLNILDHKVMQEQTTDEKDRIQKWQDRREKAQCGFSYEIKKQQEEKTVVAATYLDKNLTQTQKIELQLATLYTATGTINPEYGQILLNQTISGFSSQGRDIATTANAAHGALLAMNPQDEYEGMLCCRLLVLHDQYMRFMINSASPNQSTQLIDSNINRATKLMRLYNETLDTLNRHRRKGEQKVTVQHVNVNGGQAVVAGQFTQGGG